MKTVSLGGLDFSFDEGLFEGYHCLGPEEDAARIRGDRPEYIPLPRNAPCNISKPSILQLKDAIKRIASFEENA